MSDGNGEALSLSIVICTYNRPDLISQVLSTLAEQDAPAEAYEALVIDNASPGDIAAAVRPFAGRIPGLRCIREEQVGLSHARNSGYREARGEYVAYVDDDCKLPPEWVSTALRVIREVHPVMFGGPYRAFYMTPKPKWYKDAYGSNEFAGTVRTLEVNAYVTGGNMVIRKDALEDVGGFDPELGMTGMTMAYGEETALQDRLRERFGPDAIHIEPGLRVDHLVRPEKMSVLWIIRRRFLGGLYGYRCSADDPVPGAGALRLRLKMLRIALGFALDIARAALIRDRRRYPALPNYIWEHASYRLERLGQVCGQLESWNASGTPSV